MSAATDRLQQYNGNPYKAASNPFGLDGADGGVSGLEQNLPAALNDLGAAAVEVAQTVGKIAAAQSTLAMVWDVGTADADPGAGKLRASVAVLAGAFTLYVSATDSVGASAAATLAGYAASTSAIKGRLRLVKIGAPTVYADVDVTALVVAAGYRKLSVSYVAGPGGFAAGDAVALGFSRAGDLGQTGANGAGPNWGGTSGGAANAQTLTPAVPLSSLAGNPSYEFVAGYSITGAATLNVSGTGDVSFRKADGAPAGKGDVVAGTKYVVTLVSGQWRLASGGMSTAQAHALAASFL